MCHLLYFLALWCYFMNLCLEYMQECGFVLCLLSIMFLKRITFFVILACKQHNIYILTQWLFCIFILSWMQIAFQLNFDLSHWQNIWAECQLIGLPIKKIFFVLCDSTDKNMVTFFKISNSKWAYNIPLMSGLGKCHLGFYFYSFSIIRPALLAPFWASF